MERFPKYLKAMPIICGLSFYDMGGLMLSLYLAMIFELSSLYSLGTSLIMIVLVKFSRKYFDFTGFFLPRVKTMSTRKLKGDKR